MSYGFKNLQTPSNRDSGVGEVLLLAPRSWITTLEEPTIPGSNQGDEITISGDHVFAANKGFVSMLCSPQKNQLDIKTKGDLGTNGQMVEGIFFFPGSYKEVHEQVKNFLNEPLIALVKDANCPAELYYQLGCECTGCYLTADFSTGTTKDGAKGYNVKLHYDGGPLIYAGAIDKLA